MKKHSSSQFWLLFSLFEFAFCALHAQNSYLLLQKTLNSPEISNSRTNAMVIDQNGYLWLGTQQGLNRWNGNNYRIFMSSDSTTLTSDYIMSLCADEGNRLWIGTETGINLIENHQVKRRSERVFKPAMNMASLNDNNLVVTGIDGLYLYDKNEATYHLIPSFPTEEFQKVAINTENKTIAALAPIYKRIYFGKAEGSSKAQSIQLDNQTNVNQMVFFHQKLYLATTTGLYLYGSKNGIWNREPLPPYLDSICKNRNILFFQGKDDTSHVFLAIQQEGLMEYDLDSDQIFRQIQNSKSWNNTRQCIGTYYNNKLIICKDTENIEVIGSRPNINTHTIWGNTGENPSRAKSLSSKGLMIFCTNKNVYKYDINTHEIQIITPKELADRGSISVHLLDNQGNIWMFTDNHILQKFPLTGNGYGQPIAFNIKKTECIWDGPDHSVCILNEDGLYTLEPTGSITRQPIDGIQGKQFWYALTLKNGTIMAVCMNDPNIYMIDKSYLLKKFPHEIQSLGTFKEDQEGNLWLTTLKNGIYHYDSKHDILKHYTMEDGLAHNDIRSFCEDDNGHMWLTHSFEISEITNDGKIKTVQNLSKEEKDGINNCLVGPDHNIYFLTRTGITVIDPNIKIQNAPIHKENLMIDAIIAGKRRIDITGKPIELDYQENNISIYYNYSKFIENESIGYICKLDGADKDWVHCGIAEKIDYTNLPSGKYMFHLRMIDEEGNISTGELCQEIIIKYHPLLSPIAICIYLILLGAIFMFIIRLIFKQKLDAQLLQMAEHEKNLSEKLHKEKIEFFTNISHEYRTPLTLIYGPSKKLQKELSDYPEWRSMVELISRNTEKLLNLSDKLLDFNKKDSSPIILKAHKNNLSVMIQELVDDFKYQLQEHHQTLTLFMEKDLFVLCDSEKIEKILLNLVSNAIKYTEEGGSIEIKVNRLNCQQAERFYEMEPIICEDNSKYQDDYLEITVTDNGIGIPKERIDKLFQRYQRLHTQGVETQVKGYGIGLNFSMLLAITHHGIIKAWNNHPKGTCMGFIFPISEKAYKKDEVWAETLEESSLPKVNRPAEIKIHEKDSDLQDAIMLVEDNTELRSYLKELLINQGYDVTEAEDGQQALDMLRSQTADLILSDILMPNKNGLELCHDVKQNVEFCHIPVVLLTALGSTEQQISGLKEGADAYVKKPFEPDYLIAVLESTLKNRKRLQTVLQKQTTHTEEAPLELAENSEETVEQLNPLDQEFMEKLMELMEKEIGNEDFNLANLFNQMNMSHSTFFNKVKGLTGLAPQQYMITYRMNRAMEMLKSKRFRVGEVCYAVGFSSLPGFSRAFKKQFGIPPSAVE